MKLSKTIIILILLWFSFVYQIPAASQSNWYKSYELGLKAMDSGNWSGAAEYFKNSIKIKSKDTDKIRAYGTTFTSYYPHRELGICYYNLGLIDLARQELSLSLSQSFTNKAREYLDKIGSGVPPPKIDQPLLIEHNQKEILDQPPPPDFSSSAQVGERLRIAILPLENKGSSRGIDLLDKLITVFVNVDRFKVLERAQLEKVLEEHKLGFSGFIDASTAAEIGKGIGVDAVVTGSVTWNPNDVSIDTRFIDTETAAIISAQDSYSNSTDLKSLNNMLEQLALKIKNDLPIVNGYVISVNGDKLTLDIGRNKGIKKGMKCYIYREGAPIIHPVSKKVIGKMIDVLSEIQLREVYEEYSVGYIIKQKDGIAGIGDMVITK